MTQAGQFTTDQLGYVPAEPKKLDDVVDPDHYKAPFREDLDAGDVVDAWGFGFWPGNAWKYLARHGRKGTIEDAVKDLRKAAECADRAADLLEKRFVQK